MFPAFFNRHRFWLSISILFLGFIWIAINAQGQILPNSNPALLRGFLAPDFFTYTLTGDEVHLSDYRGKPILLNFWASWCPPCRAKMPTFQKIYAEYAAQGFIILGINSQESKQIAASFAESFKLTFPILIDENGEVTNRYRVDSLPTTLFIDRDGYISEVMYGGPISEAVLRIQIEKILAEKP